MKLKIEAIRNLEQKKCVAASLKNYTADMAALTYHAGVVLASMNAYGMYDRIYDEECPVPEAISRYFKAICCELIEPAALLLQKDAALQEKGRSSRKEKAANRKPEAGAFEKTECEIAAEWELLGVRLEAMRSEILQEAETCQQDAEQLEEYASLLEVLNPLYASFLVYKQAGAEEIMLYPCKKLLALTAKGMTAEPMLNLEEMAMEFLIPMEGLQERYYQPLYRYQLAFPDIQEGFAEAIAKQNLTADFALLAKTRRLLSSSPFAFL